MAVPVRLDLPLLLSFPICPWGTRFQSRWALLVRVAVVAMVVAAQLAAVAAAEAQPATPAQRARS